MTRPASSGHPLPLGPGPEFDRIREVARVLGDQAAGLGDDCALIRVGDEYWAFSTDVSVEDVHFRRDWIGLEEAGWRATAAALSDLAAEGAQPIGLMCGVTQPGAATEDELLELMSGVGAAARSVGAPILGGDLVRGPVWSVAGTVVGRTPSPVSRGGAEPGDGLWVTGTVGAPRAALEAWRRGETPLPGARARFAHPEPRIQSGQWLARHGAHAMIDLSDGLGGDAWHLAAASGVALEINLDLLPVAPEVNGEARRLDISPQQFAAEGGEDYELLVALPPHFEASHLFAKECGVSLVRVGSVGVGSGVRFLLARRALDLRGFDHFG